MRLPAPAWAMPSPAPVKNWTIARVNPPSSPHRRGRLKNHGCVLIVFLLLVLAECLSMKRRSIVISAAGGHGWSPGVAQPATVELPLLLRLRFVPVVPVGSQKVKSRSRCDKACPGRMISWSSLLVPVLPARAPSPGSAAAPLRTGSARKRFVVEKMVGLPYTSSLSALILFTRIGVSACLVGLGVYRNKGVSVLVAQRR